MKKINNFKKITFLGVSLMMAGVFGWFLLTDINQTSAAITQQAQDTYLGPTPNFGRTSGFNFYANYTSTPSGNLTGFGPRLSMWHHVASGVQTGVNYYVSVTNSSGQKLKNNDSVQVGDVLTFKLKDFDNFDIAWNGTGFNWDTPYGYWVDELEPNTYIDFNKEHACDVSDTLASYTYNCTEWADTRNQAYINNFDGIDTNQITYNNYQPIDYPYKDHYRDYYGTNYVLPFNSEEIDNLALSDQQNGSVLGDSTLTCSSGIVKGTYLGFLVKKPTYSITHNGTAKLDCSEGGWKCTVVTSGNINSTITINTTRGVFLASHNVIGVKFDDKQVCWASANVVKSGQTSGPSSTDPDYIINVPMKNISISLSAVSPVVINPPTVSGDADGFVGDNINFSVTGNHPNNNPIRFLIDWSDTYGESNGFVLETGAYTTPTNSNGTLTQNSSRAFSNSGSYSLSVKTEDDKGIKSNSSNVHQMTIHPSPSVVLTVNDGKRVDVNYNQNITLKWNAYNADSCVGFGFTIPNNSTSGSLNLTVTENKEYGVNCTKTISNGKSKTANDSVSVGVTIPEVSCGTSSWQDGWNFYGSASEIPNSGLCGSDSSVTVYPQEYTDPNNKSHNFWWQCGNSGITKECYALKTPTVVLTANPDSINIGDYSRLTLKTENVKSCSSPQLDFVPSVNTPDTTTGTYSVRPNVSTNYVVNCLSFYNGVTQYSDDAMINVNVLPASLTLTADKTSIWADADTSNLSWTGTNIQNCRFSQGTTGNISNSGSQVVSPDVTTTYKVTCDKTAAAGGGTIDSNTITINAIPLPTATLTATPNSIWQGSTTTLSWTSTNATTCSGSSNDSDFGYYIGYIKNYNSSGEFNPTENTTYALSCSKTINTNSTRTATANASVTVNPIPPLVVDLKIRNNGQTDWDSDDLVELNDKGQVDFYWSVSEAESCTLTPSIMGYTAGINSQSIYGVELASTANYTLTCTRVIAGITQTAADDATVSITYSEPTCGSANNKSLFSQPAGTDACSSGTFVEVNNTLTEFKWGCSQPGHATAQCSASIIADDGSNGSYCGGAKDQFYPTAPSKNFCTPGSSLTGSVSSINDATKKPNRYYWQWSCQKKDDLGQTRTSTCRAYIRPLCPTSVTAKDQCNNPSGSIATEQIAYDTYFGWSCAYDYSEVGSVITDNEKTAIQCKYYCPTGQITQNGSCVNKGQVDITRFAPTKEIINKGDDCKLEWVVEIIDTTPPDNTVTCVITGSGTHNVSYTGNGTNTETKTFSNIQNKSDYTLTCSINGVTPVPGITTDSAQASCIINPDFEEI